MSWSDLRFIPLILTLEAAIHLLEKSLMFDRSKLKTNQYGGPVSRLPNG